MILQVAPMCPDMAPMCPPIWAHWRHLANMIESTTQTASLYPFSPGFARTYQYHDIIMVFSCENIMIYININIKTFSRIFKFIYLHKNFLTFLKF